MLARFPTSTLPIPRQAFSHEQFIRSAHSVRAGAVALTYAALGDRDQSFAWLKKAASENSSFMTSLKYWPALDPLRSDPRYADLLKRVGLPL